MTKYIKNLLAFTVAVLATASCNDNFEEGPKQILYPNRPDLGVLVNDYTADGGTAYTVNITLNEAGDTVCDVTTLNTANGRANVFSQGKVSYNPETGVMKAEYDESMYETPALITVSYKNDLQKMTVNIYSVDGGKLSDKDVFTAVKGEKISYFGDWQLSDGRIVSLNADYSVTCEIDEDNTLTGKFEEQANGAKITLGDEVIVLTTDAQGRTYDNLSGSEGSYATHILTQPKNDWYELAIGNYISWLFASDGKGNEYPYECVLEYSPSREMARISGWLEGLRPQDLTFYWIIGDSKVTPAEKMFGTSYSHTQDGQNLGEVYAVPVAIDEAGNTAVFEDNIFYFGTEYAIPGVGSFGSNIDRFEITLRLDEN